MTAVATEPSLDAAQQVLAELPPAPAVWASVLRKR